MKVRQKQKKQKNKKTKKKINALPTMCNPP